MRLMIAVAAAALAAGVGTIDARSAVAGRCDNADDSVVLCDDFEHGVDSSWDVGTHQGFWPSGQFVLCTDQAFGFQDGCAAWSNFLSWDLAWGHFGYDARRPFAPLSELYVRWYQFISDPYAWGSLEDKSVMLHDQQHTLTAYVATNRNGRPRHPNSGPGMPFIANYQDVDWPETANRFERVNRFQNQRQTIALQPGRWYVFEWYVRMNTPGISDGVTRLWIDEASPSTGAQTLRAEYSDMRWLKSADADKSFGELRLTVYHQRCDDPRSNTCPPRGPWVLKQSQRWDHVMVSRKKIGTLR